jgi:tetratricopeptide (TPR) repeat protein
MHNSRSNYEAALALYDEALERRRRQLLASPESAARANLDMAQVLVGMARVHRDKGDIEPALSLFAKAQEVLKRVGDEEGEAQARILAEANILQSLAQMWKAKGDTDKCLDYLKQALDLRRARLPPLHPDIPVTLTLVGRLHEERKEYAQAGLAHRVALEQQRLTLPRRSKEIAVSLYGLGNSLLMLKRFQQALKAYREALDIWRSYGPNVESAKTLNNMAATMERLDDQQGAVQCLHEAVRIYRRLGLPDDHPSIQAVSEGLRGVLDQLSDDGSAVHPEEEYSSTWHRTGVVEDRRAAAPRSEAGAMPPEPVSVRTSQPTAELSKPRAQSQACCVIS